MAKVQFSVDSGANIQSKNESGWLDTVEDLGYESGEWEEMTDDEKCQAAYDWANNHIDVCYEEK